MRTYHAWRGENDVGGRDGTRSGWRGNIAGQLGKQDNCQVAVSLSLANRHASLPVAWRLYLPQEWAADPARRRKAHVPADITFKTSGRMSDHQEQMNEQLEQIWVALHQMASEAQGPQPPRPEPRSAADNSNVQVIVATA